MQDRSKTNVFVIDCEEEEKRKKRSFVLFWNKAKKNEDNRSSTIEDLPLLLLVADALHEVVQGAANDGVGTVVQRLERRYVAVPPHEHCRCAGEVVGQLRRRLAGGGGVVSSGRVFGSTQCLRKLLKKSWKEVLGNLKIGQVK